MMMTCLIGDVVLLSFPAAKAGEIELPVKAPTATQANNFRRSPTVLRVTVFMALPEGFPVTNCYNFGHYWSNLSPQ
jgi:hypothetical protein